MPWTAKDAKGHTKKANTPKKQRGWAKTANSALKRCLAGGESKGSCEGRAVRIANAAVTKMGEDEGADNMLSTRGYFTSGSATVEISALDVGGEKVPVSDLVEAYLLTGALHDSTGAAGAGKEGEETTDFTEAVKGSLEDYAMSVKDSFRLAFKTETVTAGVIETLELWPRDVFKDSPELGDVVVVRGEAGLLWAVEYKETDEGFSFATRENWKQVVLTYVPVGEAGGEGFIYHGEGETTELSESASGHVLGLAEEDGAVAASSGQRAPLLMDVVLIQPGWGNKRDNRYYTRELLKRDAGVFEGAKMYATDHRANEKSVRTEVSTVKKIKGFTTDGAPIASVAVHDPDFAEATRNRKALGTLESLECSILARGKVRNGEVGGRKGHIVEAISSVASVDWVTKAGAGGHAIALVESDIGGVNMLDKEQVGQLLSESALPQDVQERLAGAEYENEEAVKEAVLAEVKVVEAAKATKAAAEEAKAAEAAKDKVTYLAEAEVETALKASGLPQQAQTRLAEKEYLDGEALKAAVEAERAYIKELTGSGRPFAQGESATTDTEETMSEADYDEEYASILSRHGLQAKVQKQTQEVT